MRRWLFRSLLCIDLHPGEIAGHAKHGDGHVSGGLAHWGVQDVGGHGVRVRTTGHPSLLMLPYSTHTSLKSTGTNKAVTGNVKLNKYLKFTHQKTSFWDDVNKSIINNRTNAKLNWLRYHSIILFNTAEQVPVPPVGTQQFFRGSNAADILNKNVPFYLFIKIYMWNEYRYKKLKKSLYIYWYRYMMKSFGNKVLKIWGQRQKISYTALQHIFIGRKLVRSEDGWF
jgi:hypothetical protein